MLTADSCLHLQLSDRGVQVLYKNTSSFPGLEAASYHDAPTTMLHRCKLFLNILHIEMIFGVDLSHQITEDDSFPSKMFLFYFYLTCVVCYKALKG